MADYTASLDERWPQRAAAAAHIIDHVQGLSFRPCQVVELCPGAGALAEGVLASSVHVRYTGVDFSLPLLAYTRDRLARFGPRATLHHADLSDDRWPELLSHDIHAIISMQSLHDLGDAARVERVYRRAHTLLQPGGLFLNADLTAPATPDPQNPGRLRVDRHLEILHNCGYANVDCTWTHGDYACCAGYRPEFTATTQEKRHDQSI